MKAKNVMEFVKTHKKEVAVATVAVVGGVVVFAITKKKPEKSIQAVETVAKEWRDLDPSVIKLGTITDLVENTTGEYIDMIVNDINVGDLAAFAEELKNLEGVTSETGVSAIVSLSNNWTKQ